MRLSEWRARAPSKDSTSPKVMAIVETALETLGAERDPDCWLAWGDDPGARYLVFAASPSGLVQLNVRVNVPGEGPRAGGKVIRWSRVQLGELSVEVQGGHRLVNFQVETQVLSGVDDMADRIADFAQALFAAVDGRPAPPRAKLTAQSKSRSPSASARSRASVTAGRPGTTGAAAAERTQR